MKNHTNHYTLTKIILVVILLLPASLLAQSSFELGGEFRPRFEFRDGYKSLKDDNFSPAAFVSQRTRLILDYKNPKVETRITFFDNRLWGDQPGKKDISSVGIHEAWAAINLSASTRFTFGRQSIQYDNGRLFSAVNWNQVGAAHDAARITFRKDDLEMELLSAWNQNREGTSGTDYIFDGVTSSLYYKNLNVFWLSKKFNNFQVSSLSLFDGYEEVDRSDTIPVVNPDRLNYRFTTGLILKQKAGKMDFIAHGFYQGGKLYTGSEISAYYFRIEAAYKASGNSKFTLGFEQMSGNNHSDTTDTKSRAFDILYGARHKYNGSMDYFSIPSTTGNAGLMNPFVRFDYSFGGTSKLAAEYHMFFLGNSYLQDNPGTAIDRFLGYELDISYQKKIYDYMSLSCGYSILSGTESLEALKGGNSNKLNQWAYLMLTINPTFFASRNE